MELGGGHSKSIKHPERGLTCPETSTLPAVFKFQVHVEGTGYTGMMPPTEAAEAANEAGMDTILKQPCFETRERSFMFLCLTDGVVVGGCFPSQSENQALHHGWSDAEYFRVMEGSAYTVGDQPGRGTVRINLAMAKSAVQEAKLQAALDTKAKSQDPMLVKAAEEDVARMCGAVVKKPDVLLRGLAVDGAKAIEAEVIPGDVIQLYGNVTTTTVTYSRSEDRP